MEKLIFFDLEGPLSPQDNAYEVMGLMDRGHEIFEVISRYDDLLALEGRKDYEAGDTLSLIAPFLVYHNVKEEDIESVSSKAVLVNGSRELIQKLMNAGWEVFVISTSYEQHAFNICDRLGVPRERIRCTSFPLNKYAEEFGEEDFGLLRKGEEDILSLYPPVDDDRIKERLDRLFFEDLPRSRIGSVITSMRVVGGQRKIEAMERIAGELGAGIGDSIVVGDSITDMKMLEYVKEKGGISVAFNGNQYAIPHSSIALATTDMRNLQRITDAWEEGGKTKVVERVRELEGREEEPYFHLLLGRENFDEVLRIHTWVRDILRGKAAKLG